MGNSLRCCLGCVLPCGILDLIRVVHLNGYVEEFSPPVTASEILKANPNHVLSKPAFLEGNGRKTLILSPDSELKRGTIYFLIPEVEKKHCYSWKKRNRCVGDAEKNQDIVLEKKERRNRRRSSSSGSGSGAWTPHLESIIED